MYTFETFSSLGFLYNGYDVARGRYAFESLVMLRKAGAVFIGNTVTDPSVQLTSTLLMMVLMTVIQLLLRPFAVTLWSALDTLSLVSVLVTLVASIMYLRWATPAHMCEALSDADVLPGTVTTCAEVRAQLARTNVGVSVVLILMHLGVALVFAATMLTLWRVRARRAVVRAELAKWLARRPAQHAGSDAASAATTQQEEVVRQVVASFAASARTSASTGGCCSRLTRCGRSGTGTDGGAAAGGSVTAAPSPSPTPTRRSSLARRVSAATAQFIKQRASSRAADAANGQAGAAAVTPQMVTRASLTLQEQLDIQSNSGVSCIGRVFGCCCGFLARRVKQPLLAAVHSAAESAEQTTDLIRSSAVSSCAAAAGKSDSQLNPLQHDGGAAAAATGAVLAVQAAGGFGADAQAATPGSDSANPQAVRLRAAPRTSLRSIRALNPQSSLQHEQDNPRGASTPISAPTGMPAVNSSAAPGRAASIARFTAYSRRGGHGALATANPLAASVFEAGDSDFAPSDDRDRASELPRAVFAAVAVSAADDLDMRPASSAFAGSSWASPEVPAELSKPDLKGDHPHSSSAASSAADTSVGSTPSPQSRVAAPFGSPPVPSRSRRSLASSGSQSLR